MTAYTPEETLRVAKRFHNNKRPYLLVNPLQAKHIPVSPVRALEMMEALGAQLAEEYPRTRLVIGFAETATAVGAAVAGRMGEDCIYLPTTREEIPGADGWVLFSEEHSHAVEQKLWAEGLRERIEGSESIIFVDDEISTGKTLRNMIGQLREQYPGVADKQLVAASLLNRLSDENLGLLSEAGAECRWLVRLPEADYAQAVAGLSVEEAPPVEAGELEFSHQTLSCGPLPDPRRGVLIQSYHRACREMVRVFVEEAVPALGDGSRLAVLGTEECMYPALVLGRALEERGFAVRCHATTRSPIGICDAPGYPITSGRKLRSFYEAGRNTYIYNLSRCDALIVVSDTAGSGLEGLRSLAAAWEPCGYQKLFLIQGGRDVWYI